MSTADELLAEIFNDLPGGTDPETGKEYRVPSDVALQRLGMVAQGLRRFREQWRVEDEKLATRIRAEIDGNGCWIGKRMGGRLRNALAAHDARGGG